MSLWTMIFLIVLVGCITSVMTERYKALAKSDRQGQDRQQPERFAAENAAQKRELEDLRERIKVLERIATDANSASALEARRVSDEIEALRDRQDS
ncbi:hypothetical protein [Tsuneonella amylolytica]|uniref:hypothetical protein n=1 Tax=Tsuneonella amylolytica TaxID=2338327 RepID=UPI000EA9E511|nr:hypothetical protein [Tsuneonella amylolytica]